MSLWVCIYWDTIILNPKSRNMKLDDTMLFKQCVLSAIAMECTLDLNQELKFFKGSPRRMCDVTE